MNINEIGEFGFIEQLKKRYVPCNKSIIKGIGDDAGVFERDENSAGLITTDMLIEDIHFRLKDISPCDLGYKSLAVNLSDIAAMGGIARTACVSLAVPENISYEFLMNFYEGMEPLLEEFNVMLIGGDTNRSPVGFVINVVVTGIIKKDEIIYRSGAAAGDIIMTTGYLGDSSCGLDILFGKINTGQPCKDYFYNAHIKPRPHIREGRLLAESRCASALIDISDGLASDLRHICEDGGVGAVIYQDAIPVSENLKKLGSEKNINILDYALFGGEDYCLLAVISAEKKETIINSFNEKEGVRLFEIGEIVQGSSIEMGNKSGERKVLPKKGFSHF